MAQTSSRAACGAAGGSRVSPGSPTSLRFQAAPIRPRQARCRSDYGRRVRERTRPPVAGRRHPPACRGRAPRRRSRVQPSSKAQPIPCPAPPQRTVGGPRTQRGVQAGSSGSDPGKRRRNGAAPRKPTSHADLNRSPRLLSPHHLLYYVGRDGADLSYRDLGGYSVGGRIVARMLTRGARPARDARVRSGGPLRRRRLPALGRRRPGRRGSVDDLAAALPRVPGGHGMPISRPSSPMRSSSASATEVAGQSYSRRASPRAAREAMPSLR
jgi:hypothetical protein